MLPCLAQRHRVILPCGEEMAALTPNAWGLIEGSDDPKFGTNLAQVFFVPPREGDTCDPLPGMAPLYCIFNVCDQCQQLPSFTSDRWVTLTVC